jgi:hypothetical protein
VPKRPWETVEAINLDAFDPHDFHEVMALRDALFAMAEVLEMTVGQKAADAAFAALLGRPFRRDWIPDPDWRNALRGIQADRLATWPIVPRLHALRQYALFGRVTVNCDAQYKGRAIRAVIRAVEPFVAQASEFWELDRAKEWLVAAQARRTLKEKHPISIEALALIGGVQLRHVKNQISKGKIKLNNARPRQVPRREALKWLETCRRYYPSEA